MESKEAIEILENFLGSDKSVPVNSDLIPSLNEAIAWALDCMHIVDEAIEAGDVYAEDEE